MIFGFLNVLRGVLTHTVDEERDSVFYLAGYCGNTEEARFLLSHPYIFDEWSFIQYACN